MNERDEAIKIILEARQSHVDWRDHLLTGCDGSCATSQWLVETPEIQQQWVDKYDLVLRELGYQPGPSQAPATDVNMRDGW